MPVRCRFCGRFMKKFSESRHDCACGASLIFGEWYAKWEKWAKKIGRHKGSWR